MAYVPGVVRQRVTGAAQHRCGYCLTAQQISGAQMHIEHLIPVAHGGTSDESNLWLSCAWCNRYKAAKTQATDPNTQLEVPLYNPRTQRWREHFHWSEDGMYIIGLTPTGVAARGGKGP